LEPDYLQYLIRLLATQTFVIALLRAGKLALGDGMDPEP
jgi:hypothetical protein